MALTILPPNQLTFKFTWQVRLAVGWFINQFGTDTAAQNKGSRRIFLDTVQEVLEVIIDISFTLLGLFQIEIKAVLKTSCASLQQVWQLSLNLEDRLVINNHFLNRGNRQYRVLELVGCKVQIILVQICWFFSQSRHQFCLAIFNLHQGDISNRFELYLLQVKLDCLLS